MIEIAVINVWEMYDKKLMIVCLLASKDYKQLEEGSKLHLVMDMQRDVIRPLRFKFPQDLQEFQIDEINMGFCSVFPTFAFNKGKEL